MAHFLIVSARFYTDIADELVLGARSHLEAAGHSFDVITVPGAFELPAAIRYAMQGPRAYDGYVALGCVIRGETTHYDIVCEQAARGLQDIAIQYNAAIGFGVLTVENKAQALKRASVNDGNKGRDAAEAAIQLVALRQRFALNA